jgi:hypothetical protein
MNRQGAHYPAGKGGKFLIFRRSWYTLGGQSTWREREDALQCLGTRGMISQVAQTIHSKGGNSMTFDEIKVALMGLNAADQKRLFLEVVPQVWPKACVDDSCVQRMRELVDDAAIKKYREQHMDSV